MSRAKDVAPHVEYFYKQDQKYINSDKRLLLAYWERYNGLILSDSQKLAFMQADTAESITRAARDLRSTGKYTASEEVEKERYGRYIIEKNDHGEMVTVFRYE